MLVSAIVTAEEPLYEVPLKPVPIVNAFKLLPRATPDMVELVNAEFGMFVRVLVDPLILLLVKVSVVALPSRVSVAAGSVNVPDAVAAAFSVVIPDDEPETCTFGAIRPFFTMNSFAIPFPYPRVNLKLYNYCRSCYIYCCSCCRIHCYQ